MTKTTTETKIYIVAALETSDGRIIPTLYAADAKVGKQVRLGRTTCRFAWGYRTIIPDHIVYLTPDAALSAWKSELARREARAMRELDEVAELRAAGVDCTRCG